MIKTLAHSLHRKQQFDCVSFRRVPPIWRRVAMGPLSLRSAPYLLSAAALIAIDCSSPGICCGSASEGDANPTTNQTDRHKEYVTPPLAFSRGSRRDDARATRSPAGVDHIIVTTVTTSARRAHLVNKCFRKQVRAHTFERAEF